MLAERMSHFGTSPTLAVSGKAKEMIAHGIDVIDFSVGEPDFNTPAPIKAAGIAAIEENFTHYTDSSGTPQLRRAICEKLRQENGLAYEPDEIIVSTGAKQCLYNAAMALFESGQEILLPTPCWVSYEPQISLSGATPIFLKTSAATGFRITPEQLEAAITPQTKALILNNPSNPTGAAYTREQLEPLAEILQAKDLWVVVDEIYEKLVYDGVTPLSIASTSDWAREHTVTVNGVSKAYAMTGWRIGYAVGPRTIIKAMGRIQSQSTSNPCAIAQAAAEAALTGPQDCVEEMRAEFASRRDLIVSGLNDIPGVSCFTPKGAFYAFPRVADLLGREYAGETADTDLAFCTLALREKLIAMVPGEPFGAPGYLRMSYACGPDDIKQGLERLRAFVS